MILKGQLSLSQQRTGRNKLLVFSFLNGIALTFMTGNVFSLYLLKLGFSSSIIAVLISFGYAGALFTLTGKWFISKFGVSSTLRISWGFCGILALLLSVIPFAYNKGLVSTFEMLLIGTVFLVFCVFKSIGTGAIPPLMGEFTDQNNKGKFISKFFLFFNISTITAIIIVFFLYVGFENLLIFQILIFLAGIIKIFCSLFLYGTYESQVPMESAKSIKTYKLLSLIWNKKEYRNFLVFKSLARAGLVLVIPISMLALKTTYQIDDVTALIFASIQLVGGFFTVYIYGIISDYTGPKPLVIINLISLFVICLLWLYAPDFFVWGYCAAIFFIGGSCLFGLDSSLNHYYLTIIPRKDSVGISLWFTTIGGIVAGVAGIIFSGGLIKLYSMIAIYSNVFKYYYFSMLILLIPVLYFASTLKTSSKDEWSIKDVLKLLIAPMKIYSLYSLQTQTKYSSAVDELDNVNSLLGLSSDLSEKHLLYYLESPDFFIRSTAILSMFNLQLREESKRAIYMTFKKYDNTSVNSFVAAIVLARNNYTKALPLFRKGLSNNDTPLAWSSMMFLAIMKDEVSYKKIIKIFKDTDYPTLVSYGAVAISMMKDKSTLGCMLDRITHFMILGKTIYADEIIMSISKILSCDVVFYRYFRMIQQDGAKAIINTIDLIDDTRGLGLSTSPKSILSVYLKEVNEMTKKIMILNYLKEALNRDIPEMKELLIFKNYFDKTDLNLIPNRLMACIFIKIFCVNEHIDDEPALPEY